MNESVWLTLWLTLLLTLWLLTDKDDQQRPVRKSSYLLDPIKPRDTDQLKVDTGGTDQLEVSDVSEGSPTK